MFPRLRTVTVLVLIWRYSVQLQAISIHCHVKDATKTQGYEAVRGAECILLSNAGIFLEAAKSLTNSYGVAVIDDVQPGYYQVRASRIGYYTLSESITIPADGDRNTIIKQTMALSPRLSLQGNNDKYRIVLTWGKTPKDLDSYLLTPWSAGAQCKKGMVYYDSQKCTHQSETIDLDLDDTNMYGPETITLQGLQSNNFAYYVHIYTNGICWDKITANVKVYQASTGGLVYNIDQPTCSESGTGMTSTNCSRYWHVLDFDASTAKFTIHQNKLTNSAASPAKDSIVEPNCNCSAKTYGITDRDVVQSAAKLSQTAKELMMDKLCVNEMKKIYSLTTKTDIRLNPSDLVSKLAKFISDRIEEKRRLAKRLKMVVEDQYMAYQSLPNVHDQNLTKVGVKQCCRYDGNKARYSTEFHNWVDTQSSCWSWPSEIKQIPPELGAAYDKTSSLEQQMMDNFDSRSQKGQLKWQYFVDDTTGFFRKFPAVVVETSKCGTIDQRLEPWYIEAVRDPKNIIILFDISYTMKDNNKKEFMRSAMTQALKGLLHTDFANVVAFAGSTLLPGMLHGGETDGTYNSCFKTQLVQATWQNLLQLQRFVRDVPLASEKVSNYYNAISQALKLITNAKKKRDTHLIIVAGSTSENWSLDEISQLLSQANATLSVYSLLDDDSSSPTEQRTIRMLKDIAAKNNGVFETIKDYTKFAFRMGRFYKKLADKHTREIMLSSPLFNERLGMVVTLGAPCYNKSKELIGVVGIDITLSELLKNTVTFGPGELSYTFVIETNSGQALVHPQLPEPESFEENPVFIEENPVFIQIGTLETEKGVSDVLKSMMRRETGTKTVTSERVLSRGDPSFNGYRGVTTSFTYTWKPINNTKFAVCVVVADKELNAKEIETPKPYAEPDLYHRYDLLKYLKAGSLIEDKPIAFLNNASFPATLSRSNYYLSSSCFEDPYMFENTPETLEFVKRLSDYVNGASQIAPNPALKKDVLTDIRLTRAIETCWNRNPMKVLGSDAAWRYIVTNAGAMRQYPGRQTYNNRYDPTTRPWYHAAKSYPGKITFSVPYLDNGESGVVVTTSQTISSDSMVRAVMGIDWKMKKIHEIVSNSGAICSQESVVCMLIDPNGYVVYSKQFVSRPSMAKNRVHLAYKHPELLLDLLRKGIISTSLGCNDLELGQTYINYKIADDIPNDKIEGTVRCGRYIMVPVQNTNVYLVAIDGGDCPSSSVRCTSCSKKSCADGINKVSTASSPICIPCHCGVEYNPCTMHYYQSPNAAVACPYMTRLKSNNNKIACKMPDTDSNPLAVETPDKGTARPTGNGHARGHAVTSRGSLNWVLVLTTGSHLLQRLL